MWESESVWTYGQTSLSNCSAQIPLPKIKRCWSGGIPSAQKIFAFTLSIVSWPVTSIDMNLSGLPVIVISIFHFKGGGERERAEDGGVEFLLLIY
jgi:hypothetical protein